MSKISLPLDLEKDLVSKAQQDVSEFTPLYSYYYPHLLRFCIQKVSSKEAAEDLVSQTFQKAIKSLNSFEWKDISFSAWLYQICKRLIIDYYRTNARRKTLPGSEVLSEEIVDAGDIQLDTIKELQTDAIQSYIWQLPEKERTILYYKFYLGYSNKLIADQLSLSEGNVAIQIHRLVKKMRDSLSS